jgi:hypothetical protein
MAGDELPERRNQVAPEVIEQRLAARAPQQQQQQVAAGQQQQQQQHAGKRNAAAKPGHAPPAAHASPAGEHWHRRVPARCGTRHAEGLHCTALQLQLLHLQRMKLQAAHMHCEQPLTPDGLCT